MRIGKLAIFLFIAAIVLPGAPARASIWDNITFKTGGVIADQEFDYANPLMDLPHSVRPGFALSLETKLVDIPGGSLLTKIQYVQKGIVFRTASTSRASNGSTISTIHTYDNRADYLSIPVLYQFVIPGLPFLTYITAGPRVDILLNAQSEAAAGVYKNLRSVTAGADAGIGMQLPFDTIKVTAEIHYNHDFMDAFESPTLRVKNKALGIWVGVEL